MATFDTDERSAASVLPLIASVDLPFLVAEDGGSVLGWARLSAYSDRCAYEGVAEVSVYVDPGARGRGVGRALLDAVAAEGERRGLWKLIALIFPENGPSVALFRACGFREVGTFHRHGRLDGEWRDVVLRERSLGPAA